MPAVQRSTGKAAAATSPVGAGEAIERRVLRVRGVVQGVGFRPFVHAVATSLGLAGTVHNDTAGVVIDAEGSGDGLDELQHRLVSQAPPGARIESVTASRTAPLGRAGFVITASAAHGGPVTSLPPDAAVCDSCRRELFDPTDRRYRYPFITCSWCGPRFTIATALPYDRPNTTMSRFQLCAPCRREYEDPGDRRFHAQPLACPDCGPHLALVDAAGAACATGDAALREAQEHLARGEIVAVKGIGGFHLMCDATNAASVRALRERKGRGTKPFAVMVRSEEVLDGAVDLDDGSLAALRSPARPVVLLRRRQGAPPWCEHAAPGVGEIGALLPYSPVHHLLLHELPTDVLVCTSGNLADEPIVIDDAAASAQLAAIADVWLTNDRPIHTPCDDSVVRVREGRPMPVRRSRGWVPLPVELGPGPDLPPVLAMGGDLKGVVAVLAGRRCWLSQHLGDLAALSTYQAARRAAAQLLALTEVQPEVVAVDAHPSYLSARLGRELAASWSAPVHEVQHHHAHVVSAIGDGGRSAAGRPDRRVIGIAFDGTGYGDDGAIWGGEVLVADLLGAERVAHLAYVPLPGGDAAIEHPARTALAYLRAAGIEWDERLPPVAAVPADERAIIAAQLRRPTLTVPTSSMGRLFDAVASLTGIRHTVSYEAQAAIELEAVASVDERGAYRFGDPEAAGAIPVAPVLAAAAADVLAGAAAGIVSMRFHRAVGALVVDVARRLRSELGIDAVALTGGVFQNALLTELCVALLEPDGFDVLRHRDVPANDGGLALGQALVAAHARLRQN